MQSPMSGACAWHQMSCSAVRQSRSNAGEMIGIIGNLRLKSSVAAIALAACVPLQAMDRWAALSQIESGDNDCAVGAAGEISRFQLRLELWQERAPHAASWEKPDEALAVAQDLMNERCSRFEKAYHRPPTDFEFYVLWNAPAQIGRPSRVVRERAERFCNLVEDAG